VAPWLNEAQVPVQFSYHERQDDGSWRHTEWLAEGWGDPRPGLAHALVEATRDADHVAMYTTFERDRIRELAAAVPELADELAGLQGRLVDLKEVLDGETASLAMVRLMRDGHLLSPEARAAKRAALLAYCESDTRAMLRVLERLDQLSGS